MDPAEKDKVTAGRTAMCYCGKTAPSSQWRELPAFVYRGTGSHDADETCMCGYFREAHVYGPIPKWRFSIPCQDFKPRGPRDTDSYYCLCRGCD